MIKFLKKHIGLIIVLILILVFPTCLSNQAMLNMRIIVTGLAIDKVDDGYEVTAQYVKTTPGNESSGTSATVNFVADNDETMVGAISKLAYKAGKLSAFSHTNFIIIGKNVLDENICELLDYFIRNQIIKSSALLLFAEGNAADEIKKTENVELSVGLGLQRVFLFKEKECDGQMMSIINFLNDSKSYSKTSTATALILKTNNEYSKLSQNGGESSGQSQTTSPSGQNQMSATGGQGQAGSSNGAGNNNNSSTSSNDKYNFFDSLAPIYCFFDGKFVGTFEDKDAVAGLMIVDNNGKIDKFSLKNVSAGKLENAVVSINVKNKHIDFNFKYENNLPILDIVINVDNCEVEEIKNKNIVGELTNEEFEEIKKQIEIEAGRRIGKCFEKSKEFEVDIFHAYDLANRFYYRDTQKNYNDIKYFIDDLKINVQVNTERMDY